VLALCRKAGLAGLSHVAVDGTKIKANASKHKAMSYARMVEAEAELAREVGGKLVQAMRARIRQGGHRSRYRLRKYTVEPVFGHIKQARSFRQFLLRGIDKVRGEWAMICIAHNLAKLTT